MEAGSIYVRIGADLSPVQQAFAKVKRDAENLQLSIDRAATGSRMMAGALGALATAAGVAGLKGLKLAADYEQAQTAFTSLLGSAGKATKFLQQIEDFADVTPFRSDQLQKSAQMLLSANVAAEKVIPTMRAVGDAIALAGRGPEEVQRAVLAMTQILNKGKISMEELNQLQEAGIPALKYMAKGLKMETKSLQALIEKGSIPAQRAVDAMIQTMREAPIAGAMEQQSRTIWGKLSTIEEKGNKALRAVGESVAQEFNLSGKMDSAIKSLTKLSDEVQKKGLKKSLDDLFQGNQAAVVALSGAVTGSLIPAFAKLGVAAWGALAPLAPWIASGTALALAGAEVYRQWNKALNALEEGAPKAKGDAREALKRSGINVDNKTDKVHTPVTTKGAPAGTLADDAALQSMISSANAATNFLNITQQYRSLKEQTDAIKESGKKNAAEVSKANAKVKALIDALNVQLKKTNDATLKNLITPYKEWADELYIHSIVPDALDAVVSLLGDVQRPIKAKGKGIQFAMTRPWQASQKAISSGLRQLQTDAILVSGNTGDSVAAIWRRTAADTVQQSRNMSDGTSDATEVMQKNTTSSMQTLVDDLTKETNKILGEPLSAWGVFKKTLSDSWNELETTGKNLWRSLGDAIKTWAISAVGNYAPFIVATADAYKASQDMANGIKAGLSATSPEIAKFKEQYLQAVSAIKQGSQLAATEFVAWMDKGAKLDEFKAKIEAATAAFGASSPEVANLRAQYDALSASTETFGQFLKRMVLQFISAAEAQVLAAKAAGIATAIAQAPATFGGSLLAIPAILGEAAAAVAVFEGVKAGVRAMATGGIVTGPTPALVGEAGPEAVIPLNRRSLSDYGLGGGGGIVVNFYDTKVWRDSDIDIIGERLVSRLRRLGVK